MSIIQKLKNATVPSVYSSIASLGLYYVLVDNDLNVQVPLGNMVVPAWAAVGVSSFIGAEIGSLATEFVAPKIPMLKDFEGVEKTVVPAALAGLSTYLVMKTLVSPDIHMRDSIIIGAGGNLIGQTLYDNMQGSIKY